MDKLQESWEAYRFVALPSEVSEVHLQLAKDAFYAGAESVDADVWKPDIMPPLPDDPQWMTKLQGDIPAGSVFYDAPNAVADDPLERE